MAEMLAAAFISECYDIRRVEQRSKSNQPLSPVTTSQTSPFALQWTSGYNMERPKTVMFLASRLKFGIPYQTCASGGNYNDVR